MGDQLLAERDSIWNGPADRAFSSDALTDMADPALALLSPSHLFTRADVLATPCPTPRSPGVYAWYFDEVPEAVPTEGCHAALGHTLLYVGISPSAPPTNGATPSRQTLRSRVRYHYRGNAYGSTLRLTLGCLLAVRLGITLRRVGSGKTRTFTNPGEQALDAWMARHAKVVWVAMERPWDLEAQLIRALSLPLNIMDNEAHAFCARLRGLRRETLARALEMPVADRGGRRSAVP